MATISTARPKETNQQTNLTYEDNPMAMEVVVWEEEVGTVTYKSWAQQAEESYQLLLALALRLSSDATSADDPPNFLDPGTHRRSVSADVFSHRFWVNGSLSYYDKVPDGFFVLHGMDPYVWSMSTDLQETGRVPSFESLKAIKPCEDFPIEVVLIDKSRDPGLKELQNRVLSFSSSLRTKKEVVDHLAELVCKCMGGVVSKGEDCLGEQWKERTKVLKDCLGSIVIPIGSLSVGLCVHRAVLFKVLADMVNLPCRIAKGCKYCGRECASSCLVRFGLDREYLVDLIGRPGVLCQPDSLINGASSILISSPLCHPKFKSMEVGEDFRMLAKQYFCEGQSLNISFDDASSGSNCESSTSAFPKTAAWPINHVRDFQMQNVNIPFLNGITSAHLIKGVAPSQILTDGHRDSQPFWAVPCIWPNTTNKPRVMEENHLRTGTSSHELSFIEEDFGIQWSDLDLKEKIGSGSFGIVHRAEWCGLDVAVKILMEQDFHAVRFKEFLSEVAIMKRMRHPNVVLFMGAVTQPPNLSIVTEYLPRGSLFKLLQLLDAGVVLDDTRRLNMASDVAKGMNYLHQLKPPIVHRDLKSPNLLVDDNYRVKVCDFGLSRPKANTFLSSKTAAGTPEWMAPEVLRDERSNEKSDVFSFGVILWELVALQQPWRNLNPHQVVAAVGFNGCRLELPRTVDPQVAALIEACWAEEPMNRPSFSFIIEALQQLISNLKHRQVHRRNLQ